MMHRCSAMHSIELKHFISLVFVAGCKGANRSQERFCHESCPRVQLLKRSDYLRSEVGEIPKIRYESTEDTKDVRKASSQRSLYLPLP